jgi:hypothetical protein
MTPKILKERYEPKKGKRIRKIGEIREGADVQIRIFSPTPIWN